MIFGMLFNAGKFGYYGNRLALGTNTKWPLDELQFLASFLNFCLFFMLASKRVA